jgi:hypothetical protein
MLGFVAPVVLAGSTAYAAKGVKKNIAPGQTQSFTGQVTQLRHTPGGASFHLRTAGSHKKAGGANRHHSHEMHVTGATRFVGAGGGRVGMASLRDGEHVRVRANGTNAEQIHVFGHHHYTASFHRHRPRHGAVHTHHYHARSHHHRR